MKKKMWKMEKECLLYQSLVFCLWLTTVWFKAVFTTLGETCEHTAKYWKENLYVRAAYNKTDVKFCKELEVKCGHI